jgi:regulator of sirC expression with transglutaminase-like and TPR domain
MDKNLDFRFSVPNIPKGEALTFDEIEERCLKQLQEKEGKCVQSLINLAKLYSQAKRYDQAFRCVERLLALSDDPEEHGGYYLALGGFTGTDSRLSGSRRILPSGFGISRVGLRLGISSTTT